jgi:hypothetical protein
VLGGVGEHGGQQQCPVGRSQIVEAGHRW